MNVCLSVIKISSEIFASDLEDVPEIYKRPYDPKVPVVCIDEQSTQLIKETRKKMAFGPGALKQVSVQND